MLCWRECVSSFVGMKPLLLDTQYRMHSQISAFPSQWFYRGALKTAETCDEYSTPEGITNWSSTSRVLFVHHFHEEYLKRESNEDTSFHNIGEAELVMETVERLLLPGDVKDIAVLTPYRAQLNLLQKQLAAFNGSTSRICISTIDGFQVTHLVSFSSQKCCLDLREENVMWQFSVLSDRTNNGSLDLCQTRDV